MIRLSKWFIMVCLIYLLILICFCLFGLYTYGFWFSLCKIVRSSVILLLPLFRVIVSNTLNVKEILKIYLNKQKIYPNHQDEWYVYHSDLSWYVSDCTVSVSLRRVIRLSQWFIMVCLWLHCISITKMSDTSITVIYQAMSLTVLYHYH